MILKNIYIIKVLGAEFETATNIRLIFYRTKNYSKRRGKKGCRVYKYREEREVDPHTVVAQPSLILLKSYFLTEHPWLREPTTGSNKGAKDKNRSDGVVIAGFCVAGALLTKK